jgi:hypothetical protein
MKWIVKFSTGVHFQNSLLRIRVLHDKRFALLCTPMLRFKILNSEARLRAVFKTPALRRSYWVFTVEEEFGGSKELSAMRHSLRSYPKGVSSDKTLGNPQ